MVNRAARPSFDVAVMGAGPAGWSAAHAMAAEGLKTVCIDPDPGAPWPNNYGAWVDEFEALGLADALEHRWPTSEFVLPDGRSLLLDRPYGRVNNPRLKTLLSRRAEKRDLVIVEDRVVDVESGPAIHRIRLASALPYHARLVIDATGHHGWRREASLRADDTSGVRPAAAQVAFGRTMYGRHPFDPDRMLFMDFTPHGGRGEPEDAPPSFLYAMPFGPDRIFVEETVLVGRPPPSFEVLERRLDVRLSRLGLDLVASDEVERVYIPMGTKPGESARAVPFGAAARMVHPATGYMLTHALGAAGPLARAAARAIQATPEDGEAIRQAAQDAVWPADRVRMWAFFRLGMEVLVKMDRAHLGRFFEAFFSVPQDRWARYLSAQGSAGEVQATMLRVFRSATFGTQLRIATALLGRDGIRLSHLWPAGNPEPPAPGVARVPPFS